MNWQNVHNTQMPGGTGGKVPSLGKKQKARLQDQTDLPGERMKGAGSKASVLSVNPLIKSSAYGAGR